LFAVAINNGENCCYLRQVLKLARFKKRETFFFPSIIKLTRITCLHRHRLPQTDSKLTQKLVTNNEFIVQRVCVLFLSQTILFLAAVGSVIGQYHVYENGEGQQDVAYDSPLSPGSFTGTTYEGEGGSHQVYPSVGYVTPLTTSYGEPVRNSYSDPMSHYGAGDYSGASYDGGGFGNEHAHHGDRVRIRVSYDTRDICVKY
jgi:energy-converting hydrogenase Eha subunit F